MMIKLLPKRSKTPKLSTARGLYFLSNKLNRKKRRSRFLMFLYTRSVIQNPESVKCHMTFDNPRFTLDYSTYLSINAHEQDSSPPLNNTTYYTRISQAESQQFRCFETTLAICCYCNLTPDQAVQEFKEKYGKNPPPIYFEWWRSCRDEFEITPKMVTAWLVRVNRKGWIKRLGGAA